MLLRSPTSPGKASIGTEGQDGLGGPVLSKWTWRALEPKPPCPGWLLGKSGFLRSQGARNQSGLTASLDWLTRRGRSSRAAQ